jgi:hypothetical protein
MSPARICLTLAAIVLLLPSAAQAGQLFTFDGGSSGNQANVHVNATFSLSGTGLSIAVVNNTSNAATNGVNQVITGLRFTVADGTSLSGFGGNGNIVKIEGTSPYSVTGPVSIVAADQTEWTAGKSGQQISLSMLNNQPNYGIIGPGILANGINTSGGVNYSAGASIVGNVPHNPFTYVEGDFSMTVGGLTPNSVITGVQFLFGTSGNQWQNGVPDGNNGSLENAPEPSSMALMTVGLVGLAGFGWRRYRSGKVAAA